MSTQFNLKEIERKAFRSTYQDGLWDIYLGLVVVCMSLFLYRPANGYSPVNLVLLGLAFILAYGIFWAGKRFITLPRMGQVRFGPARKRKKTTLAITLGLLVLIQVIVLGLTTQAWLDPEVSAKVNTFLKTRDLMDLAVAVLGSFFVGTGIILPAYFSDFPRGYYIALMMSLAVFLMIFLNQPVYPIIIGGLIVLPGLALFVRFLKTYPLPGQDASYE